LAGESYAFPRVHCLSRASNGRARSGANLVRNLPRGFRFALDDPAQVAKRQELKQGVLGVWPIQRGLQHRRGVAKGMQPFAASLDVVFDKFYASRGRDVTELKKFVNELMVHARQDGRFRQPLDQ
jgi:hypothetical protein